MNHTIAAKMAEHMSAHALVAYEDATHATIADGDWCDPGIWHNGAVPGDGARAVIATSHNVTYSLVDTARLHTLRVDGELSFATNEDTRLTLDTLFVDPRGTLTIGTESQPVHSSAKAEIIIAANGDIDVSWDPLLLSRGVIVHGTLNVHGAAKAPHLKLSSDVFTGNNTISLQSPPQGWRVGDTLVVTGTRFSGWKWDNDIRAVRYHGTQDEVRTITQVSGTTVTLNEPLEFDHSSPRSDLKASIGNFTRNVRFVTESADTVPVHQRGHVMFMHNDEIDVRYAEFFQLGRTDKSQTNTEAVDVDIMRPDTNVRGRYSFHFHRSGTQDQANPAVGLGNAVFGSPGWGYVHHDSHAILHNNVSYDTFGAGFVAETGNETGAWTDNLAIKAQGINGSYNPKNNNDISTFDIARSGDGFWFQGRLVASVGNIASSVNRGFTYFHRDSSGTMIRLDPSLFMAPQALGLGRDASADDIPIRHFHGNEAYASTVGVFVVKANPRQEHDIYTVMSDFVAWEVKTGASIEYTSHYLLRDFDVIGLTNEAFRHADYGIEFGRNTTDMVVRDSRIDGFEVGIDLSKDHVSSNPTGLDQFVVIGGSISGVTTMYEEHDDSDLIIQNSDLQSDRFELNFNDLNAEGHYEYLSAATTAGTGINFSGTKTDSIGTNPIPAGYDSLGMDSTDMIALVEQAGYYQTNDGKHYTVKWEYFSDRATGELQMQPLKILLGPEVAARLGNQYSSWRDARNRGTIDLNNQPPQARNDNASVASGRTVTIDAITNDSDPEGDSLYIISVVSPTFGLVSHSDGQITYRPHFDFRGTDEFHYWVGDEHGNAHRAKVSVTVN
ncbi:G8 domain-containing protein [Gilvimarinus sp. SDUM040013]|uniref:G8 domain-containing protein n=1 Tax=Gilvimarinus gilvus TaxID=3058038 RepID=A0ABU4RZ00_9GAMM|nr:G8 domain-containing protein [Gilvimarinus sp. SDUM040013]MDO3386856.1 G8 domain-containing protein [Gilvimarinus sp. SDUM040013]MDX6848214.1 G8 domain-containing protein [Gilvimarinus sp. SDUM040013]